MVVLKPITLNTALKKSYNRPHPIPYTAYFNYFCIMTNRFIFGILSLVVFSSCYQPERDCERYKTGEFTFEYEVDGVLKSSSFRRTEKLSIEHYENKIDTATVRWLNDCEFVVEPSDKQTPIHYKILTTTQNSYTFEYGLVGKSTKGKGTAVRAK